MTTCGNVPSEMFGAPAAKGAPVVTVVTAPVGVPSAAGNWRVIVAPVMSHALGSSLAASIV